MKIVYKPYMMKQIYKAKMDAMSLDREIDKIKLTDAEWIQLENECVQTMCAREWVDSFRAPDKNYKVPKVAQVYGITGEKE